MVKLPNLDPLRFFLVSCVIIFHLPSLSKNQGLPYYNTLPIFNRGYEAVCMFFVLSGFLIIRIIYRKKQNSSFSIRNFYIRRVLRIFPPYLLVVIFGFLFYEVILPYLKIPFDNNYEVLDGILLTIFFLPNVFTFKYFPGGILEVLWSIGIEEQFYLLIAPLIYFLRKKLILVVLVLIVFIYFLIYHYNRFTFLRTYYFVYFFLLFGGIIAILEEKGKLAFLKKYTAIPFLIICLTTIYFFTDLLAFKTLYINNAIACILFGLFIHTISFNNKNVVIKNSTLNYLGKISYGIYLYHVIALNIVVFGFLKLQELNLFNNFFTIILINVLTFALSVLFAHISFKYLEMPFLKLKTKYR